MSHVFADNSQSIGHTPLVKLNHVTAGAKATVLAKIEPNQAKIYKYLQFDEMPEYK